MFEKELISLAVLFFCVIIGTWISSRFKQPTEIGLLLVGAIIGPNLLNLVNDQGMIELFIELGAILLLFVIGLEFILPKLLHIGSKAIVFGIMKLGIIFFISFEVALLLGLGKITALLIGLIFSFSSTVVIVKILEAKKLYHRDEMPLLIGVLLIEDIFGVIILSILSQSNTVGGLVGIFWNLTLAFIILGVSYFVMLKIANPIISWLLKETSDDSIPFLALALCIGFGYLAMKLGLSPAIGAFLAGSIIASYPNAKLFEHSMKPYTIMVTSLFFLSIGTLVNLKSLNSIALYLPVFLLVIILSRFIAIRFISSLVANFQKDQVIFSSITLIAISEFSLLIAKSAQHFTSEIDLISLTAFLIFTTAYIMSFSINHVSKVSTLIDYSLPKKWSNEPKTLSNYVTYLVNELGNENHHTKKFMYLLSRTLLCLLGMIVLLLGGIHYYSLLTQINTYLFVIGVMTIASLLVFLSYLLYKKAEQLYSVLVVILSDYDSHQYRKSRYVVNNLLITLALFTFAIYSPIIIVFTNASLWLNLIPVAILAFSIMKLMKIAHFIKFFQLRKAY